MYRIIVANQGGQCVQVPLRNDFSLDPATLLSKVHDGTTLMFLCSPNNPTGNQFTEDLLLFFLLPDQSERDGRRRTPEPYHGDAGESQAAGIFMSFPAMARKALRAAERCLSRWRTR